MAKFACITGGRGAENAVTTRAVPSTGKDAQLFVEAVATVGAVFRDIDPTYVVDAQPQDDGKRWMVVATLGARNFEVALHIPTLFPGEVHGELSTCYGIEGHIGRFFCMRGTKSTHGSLKDFQNLVTRILELGPETSPAPRLDLMKKEM